MGLGFQIKGINLRKRTNWNYFRVRRMKGGHIVVGPHGGLIEFLGTWEETPKMQLDVISGVFVEKDTGGPYPTWERMPTGKAKKLGRKVITCTFPGVMNTCTCPAVLLDPDWPMSDKLNRCSRHGRMDDYNLKNKPRKTSAPDKEKAWQLSDDSIQKQTFSPQLPVVTPTH